jgi:hypothetical protein
LVETLRKLRKLPSKNGSQGAVLHAGEADLAPPSLTLLLTKQALTALFVKVEPAAEGNLEKGLPKPMIYSAR